MSTDAHDADERDYDPSLEDDAPPAEGLSRRARRKFTWRKGEVEVTPGPPLAPAPDTEPTEPAAPPDA